MDKLNVFGGHGFLGRTYCGNGYGVIVNNKDDYEVKSKDILYMISTVSNYNIFTDPYIDIDTNLTTMIKVLEQCKNNGTTFNFISSWFVYGDTDLPAREDSYCNPKGFYSITKRCAEQLLISYAQTFNINYRILRMANILGEDDKKASKQKNAVQWMINEIKEGRDVDLYDNGNVFRDFIHVEDAIEAIDIILEKGELNTTYNVGNGDGILVGNVIRAFKNSVGSKSKIGNIVVPDFHKSVQVQHMYMNSDKLKALGYKPQYDFYHNINYAISNL